MTKSFVSRGDALLCLQKMPGGSYMMYKHSTFIVALPDEHIPVAKISGARSRNLPVITVSDILTCKSCGQLHLDADSHVCYDQSPSDSVLLKTSWGQIRRI